MPSHRRKTQVIVTLGPSTRTEADLRRLKESGVDFVRLNMSHSSIQDLKRAIQLAKKVGIPFIVDTEGSHVRVGALRGNRIEYFSGDDLRLYAKPILGHQKAFTVSPSFIVGKLGRGDLLYCDFNSLVICVSDTSDFKKKGYIKARVTSGGFVGSNKGVFVDTTSGRPLDMPTLTKKDHESIEIGLREKVGHVAASFMRSGEAVGYVRKVTKGKMKVISKIECIDGLKNLDDIIAKSDALLIDRGDLSKEIFLSRIPFTQKIIVHRARRKNKPAIVATNFLESMIQNARPTRAEIHDIESSITDGASGLTLAAETAIGKYPFESVRIMQNVIQHITSAIDIDKYAKKEGRLVKYLEATNYLLDFGKHSPIIPPNGGTLVDRVMKERPSAASLVRLPKLQLSEELQMDVEQIALGAYSPLTGFMTKKDLASVLRRMRLSNGVIWPLPIVLDVEAGKVASLRKGDTVALLGQGRKPMALLHVKEKYTYDKRRMAKQLYGTLDPTHPGVRRVRALKEIFLAGDIDLLERRSTETKALEFSPRQTRRIFEDRGWHRVVGFHTRNVIHRGHEFIQLKALAQTGADGLFVHPVIGKKKAGDFNAKYIVESYQIMQKKFYPKDKVLFGTWASYSRYAGPREALFTAIVRQNYGCSHFIVGRDHTGVGSFYAPDASHKIFDRFPDLAIKPVRFDHVFYSKKLKRHVHHKEDREGHRAGEVHMISGTEARKIVQKGKTLPAWFMRKEIAGMLRKAVGRKEEVFVVEWAKTKDL